MLSLMISTLPRRVTANAFRRSAFYSRSYKPNTSLLRLFRTSPHIPSSRLLNTMPPGPVLPTLSLWAQSHITALFKATTTQEFDDAFDAFLAHHVDSIVVNGEKLTKDQYKNRLQAARALEQSAEVKYLGTVEVQDAKEGVKVIEKEFNSRPSYMVSS